ncbi:MAG TPA: hypothetical protein VFY87_18005 [Geminicoccaceae bacterium]|nr:hypothetical protein [Geminicoccaceae bacterium]
MKKFSLLIAALHASALALGAFPVSGHAQDAAEIRAYMDALSAGTPEAMSQFLTTYPNSALPGSELGASIAAGLDNPTASIGGAETSGERGWDADDGVY